MNYEIPLYSKNPDYMGNILEYDSAKGYEIKIKNKKYLDMGTMGIGCCILGYHDSYVDFYVKREINKGCFSSLNTKYMNKLSNLLLALHPEFDLIRYGNSAGEMLYVALKLAIEKKQEKIKNKKINILQIGYTGWIIKNLLKENNNDYEIKHIEKINDVYNINYIPDIVIGEIIRHEYPKVESIRKLNEWQKQNSILIIDEVTSGFHFKLGGVYQLYDLKPDIIVYAKGVSNGYPFACLIGKEEIVKSNLFISSTYWTSNLGFIAVYRTIMKLKHCNYNLLVKLGKSVMKIWKVCADKYSINIKIGEVPNIANFEFDYENKNELKSLFIQEMQKEGILALTQYYPSFAHNAKSIGKYAKACNKVFAKIRRYLDGENFEFKLLKEIKK